MAQIRVMHYLNQFFAGMGGEEKADMPVGSREGPLGPGKRLQGLLGDSAKIVVTAYCGDNYFAEHTGKALASILQIAREQNVEMVVAGPAFGAGRYGFACVEVCHSLSTSLDSYGVIGMHIENPGVEVYRQYKDRRVFILPTAEEIRGMEDALEPLAARTASFCCTLTAGRYSNPFPEANARPRQASRPRPGRDPRRACVVVGRRRRYSLASRTTRRKLDPSPVGSLHQPTLRSTVNEYCFSWLALSTARRVVRPEHDS